MVSPGPWGMEGQLFGEIEEVPVLGMFRDDKCKRYNQTVWLGEVKDF